MAKKRQSLSKTLRFEVFKRDGFVCQYCGGHPPKRVLEVDHIHPVSKGGQDEINNLVTSCFDCNRGKGDRSLKSIPRPLSENIDLIREKENQLTEYQRLLKNIDRRVKRDINRVEKILIDSTDMAFSETFRVSVKKFINSLGVDEVCEAMHKAISFRGIDDIDYTLRYFCGICWGKIREADYGE